MAEGRLYSVLSAMLKYLCGVFFAVMLIENVIETGRDIVWTGLFIVLCLFVFFLLYRLLLKMITENKRHRWILIGSILFLTVQTAVMFLITTTIDWDPGTVITMAGQWARGEELFWPEYFGYSPNNLFLLICFRLVLSVSSLFAGAGGDILAAVLVNIIVVDLSLLLMACCAKKIYGERGMAAAAAMGILTVGLSPWLSVPYSDTLGMLFPILLLFLYLYGVKEGRHTIISCILMGAAAAVGYMIKPHVVIILIAIILVEFFLEYRDREKLKLRGKCLALILISLAVVFTGVNNLSYYVTRDIVTDEMREEKLPFTHFIMMGLNDVTYGSFYIEDSNATHGIHGEENKKEFNIKVIRERLENYGPAGYLQFLAEKVTRIYTDGTFNYGTEGDWAACEEIFDSPPAGALQELYHIDGKYYSVSSRFFNSMWMIILAAVTLSGFLPRRSSAKSEVDVLRLTIIGLTVFLLLVEGRARYLYHLLPVFILLAVYGMLMLVERKEKGS